MLTLSFGCFFGCSAIDDLVLTPAARQHRYLGRQIGMPWALTSYSFTGFQDPDKTWTYRLTGTERAELRKHCLKGFVNTATECVLFSGHDERWAASIEIRGDQLMIDDGLW
jgi:hypothetical protein